MTFLRLHVVWLCLIFALARSAVAADYYVAPNGRDANPGTEAAPFATLQGARDAVRKRIESGLQSDLVVLVRGGTYTLTEPVVFGLQDSPTGGHTVTYAAYSGEEPVISSGIRISGWTKFRDTAQGLPEISRGKVWVADVPQRLGRFHSLFDSQGHLPRARSEGFVPEIPADEAKLPAGTRVRTPESLRMLYFPAGVIKNWPNLDDVEIVIRPSIRWTMNILALQSVDEKTRLATTQLPGSYALRPIPREPAKTAWVENVLEALAEPGHWVLDTHARKLYLWPRGNAPDDSIVAPCLTELIRVEGSVDVSGPTDAPAHGLVFRGLTFAHADRDLWTENDIGIQHDWEMIDKPDALVRFRGAENCVLENCRLKDSGGNGVRLDLYAQNNRIEGNEIRNLGQGGILLIGYGPGTKDVNKHNAILNNHIHHSGLLYWHSHAIVLWQSGDNRVANNSIHHMPRKAMCLSGVRVYYFQRPKTDAREICKSLRWSEIGTARTWDEVMPLLHTRNNIIEDNEVAHVLEKLGDGASINVTGAGEGNVIRHNYVHDIYSNEFVAGCFRTDDWQRGTLWEDNVICRANTSAWEHKGANDVVNNVVIGVKPSSYFRVFKDSIDGSRIEKNIFYNPDPAQAATFYTFYSGVRQIAKCNVGNNVYWDAAHPDAATPQFLGDLRAQGVAQSDVYADPLFVDWEHGDFRLKPGSPALKLGIKSIDVSHVGLTKEFSKRLLQ